MSRRISITQQEPKRGKLVMVLGATLLLMGVCAVWALQFYTSMQNDVFADFSQEFEQTSGQIQQGVDLVGEAANFPDSPEEFIDLETIQEQRFEDIAQERLTDQQHSSLPISQ